MFTKQVFIMPSIPSLITLLGAAGLSVYSAYKKEMESIFIDKVTSQYPLTYVSLFTGIGGFEVGIHSVFPNAKCLGYAEIDKDKISIYEKNFPSHENLGDIFSIDKKLKANLLVAGFSCKSRSNVGATSREGKDDVSFDTFFGTLKIIKNGKFDHFILENVPSRGKSELSNDMIVRELEKVSGKKVYSNIIDTCLITGANRKRVFFTTFPINLNLLSKYERSKRFEFNLDPYDFNEYGFSQNPSGFSKQARIPKSFSDPFEYKEKILKFMENENSDFCRWPFASDTSQDCARTIMTRTGTYPSGLIVDRRGGDPLVRYLSVEEGTRLLGFPKGYLNDIPKTKSFKGLGDSVSPIIVSFIMKNLLILLKK